MEYYSYLISGTSTILLVFLAIIGFFLRKQITAIQLLTDSVNELNTFSKILQTNQANFSTGCNYKHGILDKRLEDHSKNIDVLIQEVTILKTKSNL